MNGADCLTGLHHISVCLLLTLTTSDIAVVAILAFLIPATAHYDCHNGTYIHSTEEREKEEPGPWTV